MELITGLDHFTIHTNRPEETIAFFSDVLGLEDRPDERPNFEFPGAWLWAGNRPVVHLVFVEEDPGPVVGSFDHVAFTAGDFDELCSRLDTRKIDYRLSGRPEIGLRQVFVREPNGIRLEITARA